jgi:hypothetical protein
MNQNCKLMPRVIRNRESPINVLISTRFLLLPVLRPVARCTQSIQHLLHCFHLTRSSVITNSLSEGNLNRSVKQGRRAAIFPFFTLHFIVLPIASIWKSARQRSYPEGNRPSNAIDLLNNKSILCL